jgi:hypothetical protein
MTDLNRRTQLGEAGPSVFPCPAEHMKHLDSER